MDGTGPIALGEQKQGTKQLLSAAKETPVKGAPLQSADQHDLEQRPEGHLSSPATTCGRSNQSNALTVGRLKSGPGVSKAATHQMLQRDNNQVPTDTPIDNTCHLGE